eukprot:6549962-Prymnesium_polylepis.1
MRRRSSTAAAPWSCVSAWSSAVPPDASQAWRDAPAPSSRRIVLKCPRIAAYMRLVMLRSSVALMGAPASMRSFTMP